MQRSERPQRPEAQAAAKRRLAQGRPANAAGGQKPAFDWLGILIRRKGILIIFLAVSAVLGYLSYLRQDEVFASSLKLMIWTQTPPSVVNAESIVQPVSLGKHTNLITSEIVLTKAVEDGALDGYETFQGRAALPMLRQMISVATVGGAADTLTLSARGPLPAELPAILTEVVAAYTSIMTNDSAEARDSSKQLIKSLESKLGEAKSESEEAYYQLMAETHLEPSGEDNRFVNPYSADLALHKEKLAELEAEKRDVLRTIESIDGLARMPGAERQRYLKVVAIEATQAIGQGPGRDILSADSDLSELEETLEGLEQKQAELLNTLTDLRQKSSKYLSSLGSAHPSMQIVRSDLSFNRAELQVVEKQILLVEKEIALKKGDDNPQDANSNATLTDVEKELIVLYRSYLDRQLSRLEDSIADESALFEGTQKDADEMRADVAKLNMLAGDIDRKETVIRDLLDRLSEFAALDGDHSFTRIRVIDSPGIGYKVEPQLAKTLLLAVFAGGMVGFGVITLLDWAELTFHNPEEISEKLGLPVIARVPQVKGKKKASEHVGITVLKAPNSAASEAYRTCRTSMLFTSNRSNSNTFLITSPSAGDGKSTTSVNIATCFAKGGSRTVLVDCDLRRPRCHTYLDEAKAPGIAQLTLGDVGIEDIVRPTHVHENLSFVSAGATCSNAPELIESAAFAALVERLQSEFDIVIIDSPPVMPVADTLRLADFADAIMMVLRIRKGVVLASQKAVESLNRVDANLIGVVVNGVDNSSHYSDYGKYGYKGYGGYAYYADRYYGKQNKKYLEEIKS